MQCTSLYIGFEFDCGKILLAQYKDGPQNHSSSYIAFQNCCIQHRFFPHTHKIYIKFPRGLMVWELSVIMIFMV